MENKMMLKTGDLKALKALLANDKDGREAITGIHVTKDYVEATNGRALLRINRELISTEVADGVYKIVAANKSTNGISEIYLDSIGTDFPNTENVMVKKAAVTKPVLLIKSPLSLSLTRAIIELYQYTGAAYSLETLEALEPIEGTWEVSKPEDNTKPVRLDHSCGGAEYTVLIMPFKLDN